VPACQPAGCRSGAGTALTGRPPLARPASQQRRRHRRRSTRPRAGTQSPASRWSGAGRPGPASMLRCPAWACTATRRHARFPQPGQARMPQLMAGRVVQPGPAAGTGQDLIQPLRRQRQPAPRPLQHHEHPVRARRPGPLVMQVAAQRVEKPVRHRHDPVMAALALHHDQPPARRPARRRTAAPAPHTGAARPAASPAPSPGPGACAAPRPAGPPHPATRSAAASAAPAPAARSATAATRPAAGHALRHDRNQLHHQGQQARPACTTDEDAGATAIEEDPVGGIMGSSPLTVGGA
jgi:hypothetical protein